MGGKTGTIESVIRRERRTESDAVIDGVSRPRRRTRIENDDQRTVGPMGEPRDRGWIEPIGVVRHE